MMEENLPPGFRFHPTDEELITYYLNTKVSDFSFTSRAIVDVDLNKCEPWDLPGIHTSIICRIVLAFFFFSCFYIIKLSIYYVCILNIWSIRHYNFGLYILYL